MTLFLVLITFIWLTAVILGGEFLLGEQQYKWYAITMLFAVLTLIEILQLSSGA